MKRVASSAPYVSGFHTCKEDSPWIQLEARSKISLSGIIIDKFDGIDQTEHLRVWISDDENRWLEVASENDTVHRYRLKKKKKNIKAKYIRIGRESGVRKDRFSLDKVIIYGKK